MSEHKPGVVQDMAWRVEALACLELAGCFRGVRVPFRDLQVVEPQEQRSVGDECCSDQK